MHLPVTRAGDCILRHRAIPHVVLGYKKGGVLVLRCSHDGIRIRHLRAFIHNVCGGNSTLATLAAWEVASCARTAGGNPVTGRSKTSVICNVHGGARSREGVAHRPLLSIPSSQESSGGATSRCTRTATCFERHVEQIVAVLGWGQEQVGTGTRHRTQGQFADLPISFRLCENLLK